MKKHQTRIPRVAKSVSLCVLVGFLVMPGIVSANPPVAVKGVPGVDDEGCSGAGVRMFVPHQVQVLGYNSGVKSGYAPLNSAGDHGLFLWEKTAGDDWFYVMFGESSQGTCLNFPLAQVKDQVRCLLDQDRPEWVQIHSEELDWALTVTDELNPLPPCKTD